MLSNGELQTICAFIALFCFIFMLAYLLRKNYKFPKKTVLPTSRKNNTLLYIRWIVNLFKTNSSYNDIIMKLVSSLSHRYRKSGIVHFGIFFLDVVFLFHPNTVQPLLQSASNIDKSVFYKFFEEWLGSSMFMSNGEKWHKRRKLLTPTFHLKILDKFLPVIEEQSKILVERLSQFDRNEAVDIAPFIKQCVLNVLCETAMGLPTRVSHGDYATYGKHLNILLNIIQERIYALWRWPDIIFGWTKQGREFKKTVECLNILTNQIVEERIQQMKNEDQNDGSKEQKYQSKKQLAFLDILLNSVSTNSDFTLQDIRREVQFFLFAGRDSSSLTIICALHLLGKHPDIQRKVQQEVDTVLGADPDRPISKNDIYNLKYTECVIKETLRLYPVVPVISRQISEEIKVGDYKIPRGFNCVISILDLHRNPDIFPNPNLFDPRRFFPENSLGRHPYAFIPFSAGSRNCIGQKMAMLEMKMILAKIMQNMTLLSLDNTLNVGYRMVLRRKGPIRFQLRKRQKE